MQSRKTIRQTELLSKSTGKFLFGIYEHAGGVSLCPYLKIQVHGEAGACQQLALCMEAITIQRMHQSVNVKAPEEEVCAHFEGVWKQIGPCVKHLLVKTGTSDRTKSS